VTIRMSRAAALAVLLCTTDCSSSRSATGVVLPPAERQPAIRQLGGNPLNWRTFPAQVTSPLLDIAPGPDGAVWATSQDPNPPGLFRVGMNGVSSFAPLVDTRLTSIGLGPDKRLWMVSVEPLLILAYAPKTRELTAFNSRPPSLDFPFYTELVAGADGNVWYTEYCHLANITPHGQITEFAYPAPPGCTYPLSSSLTKTSDGKIWYVVPGSQRVGWIDSVSHAIKDYPLPATIGTTFSLATGTDGNVYLAGSTPLPFAATTFVRIDVKTLKITAYPTTYNFVVDDLAAGPDGLIYFAPSYLPSYPPGYPNALGAFDPSNGSFTFRYPPNGDGTGAVTVGPDGNIWSVMGPTPAVGVYILHELSVVPASLQFSGPGQSATLTATYSGRSRLSAVSSNPSVATVQAVGQKKQFVVTAQGAGTTNVIIHDARYNSFAVNVTVQ
jgi:streptogramin lyase